MDWESLGTGFQDFFLAKLFALLSSEDAIWCRLVSRQWRDASRSGVVALRPKRLDVQRLEQSFPKLRKLDLTRVGDLSLRGLDVLFRLKDLTCVRLPLVTDTWLATFYRLTQLQKLNLSSATLISDDGLGGICQLLTELTYLNLKKCTGLTNGGIEQVSRLSKLTYLNLSALPFLTHRGMGALTSLVQLEVLKLNDAAAMSDEGMEAAVKLRRLTALHFHHRRPQDNACTDLALMGISWSLSQLKRLILSSRPVFSLQGFAELTNLSKLEELRLSHLTSLSEERFLWILGKIPSLEIIVLEGCTELRPEGMSHLMALTRLKSLSLSSGRAERTPRLMDASLDAITPLSRLKELVVRGYASLSGQSFHKLTSLSSLTLIACPDLSDRHFTGLSRMSLLRALEHSYCDGLTDASLPSVAGLKALESLTIANNRSLEGNRFTTLSLLQHLTQIVVRHCEHVHDAGLASLASIRSLRTIDFAGCKEITDTGVQNLALGRLEELSYLRVADCNVRFAHARLFTCYSSKFRKLDSRRTNPSLPYLFQS